MPTISGKTEFLIDWEAIDEGDEQNFVDTKDSGRLLQRIEFDDGTGNNENKKVYRARHTLTVATGTVDLDLTDGTLLDPFGNALVFTKVKQLLIANRGQGSGTTFTQTDGENVLVGGAGAASDAWGAPFNGDQDAVIDIDSGDAWGLTKRLTGFTVSAGSSDVLRLAHAGTGDIVVDVVLIGI